MTLPTPRRWGGSTLNQLSHKERKGHKEEKMRDESDLWPQG